MTTAGNLVFQSLSNGKLFAYKADTGDKLFETTTNQPSGQGPPITYMLDGKQYIAVVGGSGPRGGGGAAAPPRGGPGAPPLPGAPAAAAPSAIPFPRVYVYTLDGKAENPTPPLSAAAPAFGFGPPPAAPGAPPAAGPAPAGGRGQQ